MGEEARAYRSLSVILATVVCAVGVLSCHPVQVWHRNRGQCSMEPTSRSEFLFMYSSASEAPFDGGVDRCELRTVAQPQHDDVHECYRWSGGHDASRGGRVELLFAIELDGSVRRVSLASNTTGITELPCCIAEVTRSWRFPVRLDGKRVLVRQLYEFPARTADPTDRETHTLRSALAPVRHEDCAMTPIAYDEFTRRYGPAATSDIHEGDAHPADARHGNAHHGWPSGSLPKAAVQAAIRRNIAAIRACYEDSLIDTPNAEGRVEVLFIIEPTGRVNHVEIGSNATGNQSLPCCIADVVRSWRFPQPDGGGQVVVTYPFVFGQEPVESIDHHCEP